MSQLKFQLNEISYTLSKNGPIAFWDFYALYYLWFRLGSGHESMYNNKFHPGKIPNIKRQEVIDEIFDKCARTLLRELDRYLYEAAVKEFHNYPNRSYYEYTPNVELRKKLIKYAFVAEKIDVAYEELDAAEFYSHASQYLTQYDIKLTDIRATFTDVKWHHQYGGKIWIEIFDLAAEIFKKYQGLPLKDVVGYIDKIYDMEHNTGSVLNKGNWEVFFKDLDKRHDIKDIKEFLPHVSHVVKALILNSLPYFDKKET